MAMGAGGDGKEVVVVVVVVDSLASKGDLRCNLSSQTSKSGTISSPGSLA
jgi:hypothetical protein